MLVSCLRSFRQAAGMFLPWLAHSCLKLFAAYLYGCHCAIQLQNAYTDNMPTISTHIQTALPCQILTSDNAYCGME